MKYFIRVIVSPLVFAIFLVRSVVFVLQFAFISVFNFIRNGGEIIAYKNEDPKTIAQIYQVLKNQNNES